MTTEHNHDWDLDFDSMNIKRWDLALHRSWLR